MNTKVVRIALLLPALLIAAPAMADTIVFQENFDSYGSGTLLTAAPGWVLGAGPDTGFVNASGKAESTSGQIALWLAMPDAFGLGNTQARIEFDSSSFHQEDIRFGAGNAATKTWDASPRQRLGWQHGNGILSISSGGGWSGTYYIPAGDGADNPFTAHYVFDVTRDAGAGTLTWTATADGASLFSPAKVITGLTMNPFDTIYWNPWEAGSTLDNFKVTAIIAETPANIVPTPGSPGTLDLGLVPVSTISAPQTVTLNNLGQQSGNVTSASLTGPFSFAAPVPGPTPYAIAGGGNAVYSIVLDPQTLPTNVPRGTPYTGTATFVTVSGTFTYDLTANVSAHDGDVNGDGQVSLLDYNIIKVNFGNIYESGNHWNDGDVNGDLQVGLLDFNIVKAHFGHTTGDVGVTAVPEPATLSLLALAGLAALRRKR